MGVLGSLHSRRVGGQPAVLGAWGGCGIDPSVVSTLAGGTDSQSKLEDKDDMVRLTLIYFLECGLLGKESQVWGYETIPLMGELYPTRLDNLFPQICNWKATNLPVFKSVGKTLFDNAEVDDEFISAIHSLDIKVERVSSDLNTFRLDSMREFQDFRSDSMREIQSIKDSIQEMLIYMKYEHHRPDTYENMSMNEEGEICDEEMNVIQNDSEVQFISPSKVIQRNPRVKKRTGKLKSAFVVTTET
ncbi:hypothetical protein FNV43_RR27148 [Rhamnella rubrinervis]|uniref:Uncharacterized protein n=1 Tax=Rhamnella rubrinervis TaxID=2594499 RepID=A0A8K0DQP5_9ROSA|nr:hypothetical protein FNV43_RR27148 [Rhamnella rubrinervis]